MKYTEEMEKHELICPSCGAVMEEHEAKCPYCGNINVPAAEREYMNKLYQMKDTLEQLPEESLEYQKKRMTSSVKKLFMILITGFMILLAFWNFLAWRETQERKQQRENFEENQAWLEEYSPILDEWYENGEFDKIAVFKYQSLENEGRGISLWNHSTFIDYYEAYLVCLDWYETPLTEEELDTMNFPGGLYQAIKLLYLYKEEPEMEENRDLLYGVYGLTERDREYIESYREIAEKFLYEKLGIESQEIENFYETAEREYGVIPWREYERLGKELRAKNK